MSDKKKRKRSRWASEDTKMVIPGMPTAIPSGLSEEQRIAYISMSDQKSFKHTFKRLYHIIFKTYFFESLHME